MSELATRLTLALLVSLVGTLVAERVAGRLGLVATPREDRWGRGSIPLLGGVAIMAGTLVPPLLLGGALPRFGSFLAAALVMGGLGLLDDVWRLRPQTKLVAQIVVAAALMQVGLMLELTSYAVLNVILTLLWIVGVTNAFNLLDNMDGLAAGMATLTAGFRLVFFVMEGDLAGASLTAAFMGATLGFLVRNFPPARIFMGDAGSLFIGFFLSGVCLVGEAAYSRGVAAVLVFPMLLVLIPIFDTTFVTLTRLVTGRPVSQGGRDHTSHRLLSLGISEGQALGFLHGISALSGLLAILSYRYGFTHTVVLLALLLVGLFLLGVHLAHVEVLRVGAGGQPGPNTRFVRLVADFPFKRQVATVATDLLLIVVAYYTAYLLRFEGALDEQRNVFLGSVGPVIVIQIASLALFGSYRGLWRYTSLPDLLRIVQGASVGVGATVLYFVFSTRFEGLSRAVFVLDWLVLVALLSATRLSFRLLGEVLRPPPGSRRRVLIYGAGDGGELTLRELRKNAQLQREPVGFLDDDQSKVGSRIHEVPVLGTLDSVEELVATHRIGEVIVASERIPSDRVRRLEEICAGQGVQVVRAAIRLE